jgi:hypothetical protein
MDQPLAPHAFARPDLIQQVHRALFEDAGAHPFFDVLARLRLDDDGVDAFLVEEMGQQ